VCKACIPFASVLGTWWVCACMLCVCCMLCCVDVVCMLSGCCGTVAHTLFVCCVHVMYVVSMFEVCCVHDVCMLCVRGMRVVYILDVRWVYVVCMLCMLCGTHATSHTQHTNGIHIFRALHGFFGGGCRPPEIFRRGVFCIADDLSKKKSRPPPHGFRNSFLSTCVFA